MKFKSLILTIGLSLFALSGLFAQEEQAKPVRYEFGILRSAFEKIIFTTSDNQEITATKYKDGQWEKDLIKKVNELNEKGWEIYNSSETNGSTTFQLRKKKN